MVPKMAENKDYWMVEIMFDGRNDGTLNGLPVGTEDSSNDGCIVGKFDGTNYGTLDGFLVAPLYTSEDEMNPNFYYVAQDLQI